MKKDSVRSFTPARFIPVISMLVRDRESAFENDMIYVKGSCHDVREMAPSHEKGIFSTHTISGCRKDRYHLSIPLKRPRDTALVRASDRLYSLIPTETPGPSCQPGRHVTLGRTYESRIRRYLEFDCRSCSVNNRALPTHSRY